MRQHRIMVETLKRYLKHKGITYKTLAEQLGQSESNVKRIFSKEALSLERFDDICEAAGTDLFQLARMSMPEREDETLRFTERQEQVLATDRKLFAYFYLLLAGLTPKKIVAGYQVSALESTKFLLTLDRLGLIRLMPGEKVSLLASKNIRWIPNGPLNSLYEKDIKNEFMASDFRGPSERMRFLNGHLSAQSLERLNKRIDRLIAEFVEFTEMDKTGPPASAQHQWFIIAYRPWRFSVVTSLKKRKR